MIPGFHTAGLLLHDEVTAVRELAGIGYRCVAVRPRRGGLDPSDSQFQVRVQQVGEAAMAAGLEVVIDAEGAFLADPRRRSPPSLAAESAEERRAAGEMLRRWIDASAGLGARWVTFASGGGSSPLSLAGDEETLERLAEQLESLTAHAEASAVKLAIRPAAGQAIATVAQFERLTQWLAKPQQLSLAADIGEMISGGELPVADRLSRNADQLACVYLCDHRAGIPGDQRIGHGDVALERVVKSLAQWRFAGPVIARVEGHAELGLTTADEAYELFVQA